MDVTLISVGIACILAAIVGGGLKALNVEVPVFRRPIQYALFTVVGLGLFALGLYFHLKQPPGPPSGITATVDSIQVHRETGCPYNATVIGTISINGGQGIVKYAWIGYATAPRERSLGGNEGSVRFDGPGSMTVKQDLLVHESESGYAYIQIEEPEMVQSRVYQFSLSC